MANEYILKDYKGSSIETTLSNAYSIANTSLTVSSGSTFPDGSSGPFVVVISRGLADEEKMLIGSRTSNTLTILEKGYDGTTSQNHVNGSSVNHCLDAYTLVQANRYVNLQATKGDLVARTASTTVTMPVGTNDYALVADSAATNGLAWKQIVAAGIATGAVTSAKILDGTIVNDDINATAAIALSKLATTGTITAPTIVGSLIGSAADNSSIRLSGGIPDNVVVGGNIYLYGDTHTTRARDVAIQANGNEVISVDGTNLRVGVLNTSPTTALDVTGTVKATLFSGIPSAATTSTANDGVGYMGLPRTVATSGAYGVVAADAGTQIYSNANRTITIPSNASIAFPVGSTLVFTSGSGTTVTIAITTDTLYLAGSGTTGSRTLSAFGLATAVKITSTGWLISGNGLT